MIHLVYASASSHEFGDEELVALLEKSRKNNRDIGVTGMLLYVEGSFFQVLEGEESVVDGLYRTICRDERHSRITSIIRETIAKRSFGEWSMAFAGASREQLNEIDGLSDFFTEGSSFSGIDEGRARKLLHAFSMGSWRKALT